MEEEEEEEEEGEEEEETQGAREYSLSLCGPANFCWFLGKMNPLTQALQSHMDDFYYEAFPETSTGDGRPETDKGRRQRGCCVRGDSSWTPRVARPPRRAIRHLASCSRRDDSSRRDCGSPIGVLQKSQSLHGRGHPEKWITSVPSTPRMGSVLRPAPDLAAPGSSRALPSAPPEDASLASHSLSLLSVAPGPGGALETTVTSVGRIFTLAQGSAGTALNGAERQKTSAQRGAAAHSMYSTLYLSTVIHYEGGAPASAGP
ncbi:hypothetical protein H920_05073 [Fukomys damarensis]|uniref:Uncharacterized protein n=1 Tax=Fukomys damarensis TaxID=885580 RepID=A0A091EDT6_FUKDA|nr:hypothetical protein H920_05073 [Fukomys damarensis]